MSKQKKWSFSKLNSFHTCPYSWYLSYIQHKKGRDSVYGNLGTCFHECMENMFKGEMTIEDAREEFKQEFELCEMLGLDFPSEKSKKNYYKAITHCLTHYKPFPKEYDYKTEVYFQFELLDGVIMNGYIDLIQIDKENKTMRVIDYKTSSKFTKKELMSEKVMQLILYSMYLEEIYTDYKILNPQFMMAKYTRNKRGTMIDRSTIDEDLDTYDYGMCFVEVEYTQEMKDALIKYVTETIDEINLKDECDEKDWKPENRNDFFCKQLCTHYPYCKYAKK